MHSRSKLLTFFLIVFLLLSFLVSFSFFVIPADSLGENWLTGWSYRKSLLVTNSSASAGTNYQVRIIIKNGTSEGASTTYITNDTITINNKLNSNFGDVRFTDSTGNGLLSAWNESQNNGLNVTCWVKVTDTLTAANATIYFYYGNVGATAYWNGEQTFLFFDNFDFPSTSLNTTLWTTGKTVSVASSVVTVSTTTSVWGGIISKYSMTYGRWRAYAQQPDTNRYETLALSNSSDFAGASATSISFYRNPALYYYYIHDPTPHDVTGTYTGSTTMQNYEIDWRDGNATFWMGTTCLGNLTTYVPTSALNATFCVASASGTSTVKADWVFLSKYVSPEPGFGTWGTEGTEVPSNPKYITAVSNVDSVADVGTHSNFTAQQYGPDTIYDNMSAGFGAITQTFIYGSAASGTGWTNPTYAYDNNTTTPASYSISSPGDTNNLVINLTTECVGTVIQYYVASYTTTITTMTVDISNETGSWANVYSATPTYNSPTITNITITLSRFTAMQFRFTKTGFTPDIAYVNETNAVSTHALQIILEEQWTDCLYSGNAGLTLYVWTGDKNVWATQLLSVQYWNGSTWITLITSLSTSTSNTVSLAGLVTSSNFTIRFYTLGSTVQEWWQIDAVYIYATIMTLHSILPVTMIAGYPSAFRCTAISAFNLSTYIFQTNNTGIPTNTSATFSNVISPQIANLSLTINSTVGNIIQVIVYANDTYNQWGNSGYWNFTTEAPGIVSSVSETVIGLHNLTYPNLMCGGITTLSNGSLLTQYDTTSSWPTMKKYQIISNDYGVTWGQETLIDASTTYISMSMFRLTNGTIISFAINITGTFPTGTCYDFYRVSNNEGATWGSWTSMGTPYDWMPWASQPIITSNGTLIVATSFTINDYAPAIYNSSIWRSDNNGDSWYLGGQPNYEISHVTIGLDEPSVVQLSNGSLYMICRTVGATDADKCHWGSISNDLGLTWSASQPIPSLPSSDTNAYVKRILSSPNEIAVIWINKTTGSGYGDGRRPCIFAVSYDDCATYTNFVTLDAWTNSTPINVHEFAFAVTSNINFVIGYRRYIDYAADPTFLSDVVIKTLSLAHAAPKYSNIVVTAYANNTITYSVTWENEFGVVCVLLNNNSTGSWLAENITVFFNASGENVVSSSYNEARNTTYHNTIAWVEYANQTDNLWNTTGTQYFLITSQEVGLAQAITSMWTISSAMTFSLALTQTITAGWLSLVSWATSVGLSQALATSWSVIIGWTANVGLSQSVTSAWSVLNGWVANVGLSQSLTTVWAVAIQQSFIIGLTQSLSSAWSIATTWIANIGLSQAIGSSWATATQWVSNIGLSQTITSGWAVVSGLVFNVGLTQTVSASWANLVVWGASVGLAQTVTSSYSMLTSWTASIGMSQSITTVWSMITMWVANVGLTQSVNSVWNAMAGWNLQANLTQTISTAWSMITQWTGTINLSQSLTAVWTSSLQWTANIDLSQSITSVWSIATDLYHMGTWTADLTQTITTSWVVLTHWVATINLTQSIITSWILAINWTANISLTQSITTIWTVLIQWSGNIGLSQGITTVWAMLTNWTANVDLAQSLTSVWSVTADWFHLGTWTADLSQTISTSWSLITQWSANISLIQSLTSVWTIGTQTAYNIGLTVSSNMTWIVDAFYLSVHNFISDLNLGISTSWTTVWPWIPTTTNLPLILGAFGVAMSFIAFAYVTVHRNSKDEKEHED